jgi:histone H2B
MPAKRPAAASAAVAAPAAPLIPPAPTNPAPAASTSATTAPALPTPSGGKKHVKKTGTMATTAKEGRAFLERGKKKRRTKRNYSSYSSFIYRVLKQVHPDLGISTKVTILTLL